jgi:hypothetical protein
MGRRGIKIERFSWKKGLISIAIAFGVIIIALAMAFFG